MTEKLKKFKGLRNYLAYQIFTTFTVIVVLILSIAFALPYFDAREFHSIEQNKRSFFNSESLNTQLEYNLDEVFHKDLMVSTINGFDVILFEQQTNSISGASKKDLNPLRAFIIKANNPVEPLKRRFGNIEIYGPFIVHSPNRAYYQYFMEKVSPQQEFVNYFFDSPALMIILLFAVSTPILLWLSWRIAKPVKALRLSADAVAMGNLIVNPDLETKGINELRLVGKSFNRMITSLQKLTTYQQRLLSDISHELKTPLTRMQLAVSLIRRRSGESSELTRIEGEIQKLDTMIQDLLSLSRQQLNQHLLRDIFSINKIWNDVFEDAKFELEQNNLNFKINVDIKKPEQYFINGNLNILASSVENIIRNAKKYAQHCVEIKCYIESDNLIIVIDDDGIGVPEDKYEEIFRPFFRVSEDRARQTGGTGLGLAIVYNAAQQHKGNVSAEKSHLGGLRVKMELPLWIK